MKHLIALYAFVLFIIALAVWIEFAHPCVRTTKQIMHQVEAEVCVERRGTR